MLTRMSNINRLNHRKAGHGRRSGTYFLLEATAIGTLPVAHDGVPSSAHPVGVARAHRLYLPSANLYATVEHCISANLSTENERVSCRSKKLTLTHLYDGVCAGFSIA